MIVAGFGFRGAASESSLRDAFARVGGKADALAAPDDKAGAECLIRLAQSLLLPILPICPKALAKAQTATHSAKVMAVRGVGSVAEAAALAGAGPAARLICPRIVSGDRMASAALAESGA